MFTSQLIVLLLLTTQQMVLSQDYVDECPVQNGLFADAVQCDRYYECKNGEVSFCFVIFKTTVVCTLGVKVRNLKMDFNTGGT